MGPAGGAKKECVLVSEQKDGSSRRRRFFSLSTREAEIAVSLPGERCWYLVKKGMMDESTSNRGW